MLAQLKMPLATICRFVLAAMAATGISVAQVNVLTWQDNNARTGLNPLEHVFTPKTVSQSTFGLLYKLPVDGAVYAQPLSAAGVDIPGKGIRNVVYVVTENDSAYAFDANYSASVAGATLWKDNFGPAVSDEDVLSDDLQPIIGITSTPVIRLTGVGVGYLYVVTKAKEPDGEGGSYFVQRLHALDLATGAESLGGPVVIQASVSGAGDGSDGNGHVPFNALLQNQRPALLNFTEGNTDLIVIAWASHGDHGPYHGWVMTYDATNLHQVSVFNDTPNARSAVGGGFPVAGGGIWQSGGGVASDGKSLYLVTGNGTFEPSAGAWGDSVIKMTPELNVLDYFTPHDQDRMNDRDADLGSSGVLLIPNDPVYNPTKSLMVQADKDGTLHLINRLDLGWYNPTTDQIAGEFAAPMHGVWGNPAYYQGSIFYGPIYEPIVRFGIANGALVGSGFQSSTAKTFSYPGPTPTISSNGATGGIVWAVDSSQYVGSANPGPAQLWAFDASNLRNLLYSSEYTQRRDVMGTGVKFSVPLVEGGRVFVGTQSEIDVFGLSKYTADPVIGVKSGTYSKGFSVTVTDATPNAKLYYTLDGSLPTQRSTLYSGPVVISADTTLQVKAFETGFGPSGIAETYYLIAPVTGTGNGLTGDYYNNSGSTGSPVASEVAPTVNFDWDLASPAPGVLTTGWSGVWTGHVQATGTTNYTFSLTSIGGARVWVNNVEIINHWTDHDQTTDVAQTAIPMVAGKSYTIKVAYYQGAGGSRLQLYWASPGLPAEIVPESQLYDH